VPELPWPFFMLKRADALRHPYLSEMVGCLIPVICLLSSTGYAEHSKVMVKDALGQSIEVALPVSRMVVLSGDGMEVVRILKAHDRVVGVSDSIAKEAVFWSELSSRPVVGKWSEPNYELIAELHPDLVLCYGRNPGPEADKKFKALGIALLRLDFYRISTFFAEVTVLGKVLEREQEALAFLAWYREKLAYIQRKIKGGNNQTRVYLESYTDFHTSGPGSGIHEMCLLAGGKNIASVFSIPYSQVTSEWVIVENPQVIVKTCVSPDAYGTESSALLKACYESINARPLWSETAALQNNGVHVLAGDVCAGPRAIIGVLHMAKWFYPASMADLDPTSLHREYLEVFHNLPYQGVYVYPEEN